MSEPELRIAVVGCGHVLGEHILAWRAAPGCRIAGFYDPDASRAARAVAQVAGSRAYATYAEAVADCDVVDLASPPQVHRDQAMEAIAASKHVLIEKPVTMTVAEWDEIAAAAQAAKVKLGAVHQLKFGSHIQRAAQWVRAGEIGDVVGLTCVFQVDTTNDPMLATSGSWVNDLPGARWFEVLPHLLYLAYPFMGRLRPGKVTIAVHPDAPAAAPAPDVQFTILGDRCLGSLHMTARSPRDDRSMVIHGSHGAIEIALLRGVSTRTTLFGLRRLRAVAWIGLPFIEAAQKLAQWVPDRKRHLLTRGRPSRHGEQARAFAAYIRGQGPDPTPAEEVRCVIDCCEAFGRAVEAELGRAPDSASRNVAVPWTDS